MDSDDIGRSGEPGDVSLPDLGRQLESRIRGTTHYDVAAALKRFHASKHRTRTDVRPRPKVPALYRPSDLSWRQDPALSSEDDVSPFVTDQTRIDCGKRLRNPKVKTLLDAGTEKLVASVSGGLEHPFRFPSADAVCAHAATMPPFVPVRLPPDDDSVYPNSALGSPAFRSARNSFDRTWPRLERYRADLAMYTLTKPAWFAGDAIAQNALAELTNDPDNIDRVFEHLAVQDLQLFEDSLFRVQLVMQAMAPSEEVIREALERMYDNIDRVWIEVYDGLLSHFKVELRPDVTVDDLAHVLTATAEGLGLRRLVQFDHKGILDAKRRRSLLGMNAFALFAACVSTNDDTQTLARHFRDVLLQNHLD
jgi:hypothetical protein